MTYIFEGRYIPDQYDLAHVAGWKMIQHTFPGLDLYSTNSKQRLTTAGHDLPGTVDDLQ